MTADGRTMTAADKAVQEFLASLPATSAPAANWSGSLPRTNEAFTVPTQVSSTQHGCLAMPVPGALPGMHQLAQVCVA
jgi:hypothetical protein